jgi:glycosidase
VPARLEVAPDGTVSRVGTPPAWAADATVYEVFVRQFVGEVDYGDVSTDFTELERRVPYIADLGVNTVWLTPICQTPTESGYHITDYFRTADDLGTLATFDSFVDACHDEGIRVVFDLVINHCSWAHPAFQMGQAGVDDYRDWFEWTDDGGAAHYFNWEHIPNFDYQSLGARAHLLEVVDFWADRVDGFRADVAWGVPHGFWKEVRERVHRTHPETLFLDETIPHDPLYHDAEFHMHYDTTLFETLRAVGAGDRPASAILEAVRAPERLGFPDDALHMRYVENHDEERYLAEFGEPRQRAAAAATFTLPGTPMVYAGQERGVETYRGPMRWHDGDTDLTDYYRSLTTLRNSLPVLREGALAQLDVATAGGSDRVVAFERSTSDARVAVVVNFDDTPRRVRLPGVATDPDATGALSLAYADHEDPSLDVSDGLAVDVRSVTVVHL